MGVFKSLQIFRAGTKKKPSAWGGLAFYVRAAEDSDKTAVPEFRYPIDSLSSLQLT